MWLTRCKHELRLRSISEYVKVWQRNIHVTSFVNNIKDNSTSDKRSLYDDLGLDPTATSQEIKSSYLELSKKYHPDLNPEDPEAAAKFHDVSNAYATLGQGKLRRLYDRGQLGRLSSVADREKSLHKFEGDHFVDVRCPKM